jgi:hypothetical protein
VRQVDYHNKNIVAPVSVRTEIDALIFGYRDFPDPDGISWCLFQSAESATDNRGSIGFDPSPEGWEKPLSPFQGSHQFCYGSRGFTPGYYLSRFQRS